MLEVRKSLPAYKIQSGNDSVPERFLSGRLAASSQLVTTFGTCDIKNFGKQWRRSLPAARIGDGLTEILNPVAIGQQVFEEERRLAERYEELVRDRELPEEVEVKPASARRLAKNHKIRTDTGVDITFPSEMSANPVLSTRRLTASRMGP